MPNPGLFRNLDPEKVKQLQESLKVQEPIQEIQYPSLPENEQNVYTPELMEQTLRQAVLKKAQQIPVVQQPETYSAEEPIQKFRRLKKYIQE